MLRRWVMILLLCPLQACVVLDPPSPGPGASSDGVTSAEVRAKDLSQARSQEPLQDTSVEQVSEKKPSVELGRVVPSAVDTAAVVAAATDSPESHGSESPLDGANPVDRLCEEVGSRLGSVSIEDCLHQNLRHSGFTVLNRPLAYKDYSPHATRAPLGRVLLIGGIHGDEFSSVSVVFKWMEILNQHHSGLFHWRFVPASNPDGLLKSKSQRQNHNGVDLNRNFPSRDWEADAHAHWLEVARQNPRRDPGPRQASEPETRWLVQQIEEFKPDVIISIHAPHHLVDYDGPPEAPDRLGRLRLNRLGVYPGSLGNYAGIDLDLPVVTVELQSAGIMPAASEIDQMWLDLVGWLRRQLTHNTQTASTVEFPTTP